MTKVCHMTSAHKSYDTRIFYKECVSLSKEGYEVFLVAQGESREEKGVKVIGVENIFQNRIKRMIKTTRKVYDMALRINADIYHFHDPELLPFALKLKKKGKKVIFDVHENYSKIMLEKRWIPKLFRNIVQKIYNNIEKNISNQLDAIIGVSPNMLSYLRNLNKQSFIITNYPIIKNISKNECCRENCICFAGGISEQWCHEEIIRALESCGNIRYKLIGVGEKDYIDKLKRLPGYSKVDYLGKIPYEKVYEELRKSRVGVAILEYNHNTSGKEGTLGNTKIFEEMYAELPIICTDFILWKEILEKFNCGICVYPKDIDQISEAINYLFNNPDKAKQLGQNGKEAVINYYNWSTQEEKLYEIYKLVLKEK